MTNKYELTDEKIKCDGHILYRIKALKTFDDVEEGELGGFVESESNLSQEGNAWIYEDAKVYGKAGVFNNAKVWDNAKVSGNARVYDRSIVRENAIVYGNAWIYNNARVYGNVKIYGNALVYDKASIFGNAHIYGNAQVFDKTLVYGDARVYGKAIVYGNASICGDAKISNASDYIVFKNFWSSGRYFTYTRSNKMWSVGCFYGTGDQLINKAYKDSKISGKNYERIVRYVEEVESERKQCKKNTKNRIMEYHYEYRLRCVDLRNGGATKGPFKKYKTAESERRFTVNMFGGHWNIERFRVYDD